jgi:hypothetical protein
VGLLHTLTHASIPKPQHEKDLNDLKKSLIASYHSQFHHLEKDVENSFNEFKQSQYTLAETNKETIVRNYREFALKIQSELNDLSQRMDKYLKSNTEAVEINAYKLRKLEERIDREGRAAKLQQETAVKEPNVLSINQIKRLQADIE